MLQNETSISFRGKFDRDFWFCFAGEEPAVRFCQTAQGCEKLSRVVCLLQNFETQSVCMLNKYWVYKTYVFYKYYWEQL